MAWALLITYGLFLSFIFFYSLTQLHLVILYNRNRSKLQKKYTLKEDFNSFDFPVVTIQLPLYNEKYVVERLVDCIAQIDYPKDKLEIQILDDSDDETTSLAEARCGYFQAKGIDISVVRRPVRSGFKAGALKYGLEMAKGEFIAIFDADFLPRPDFLKTTIPHLTQNDNLGVVQTRWEHINKDYSILTQAQAFGLDAHFTVEQVGRHSQKHFINFNGTGGIWRKACIIDAGNWQADTLTEDLDLSYRAQIKGWEFRYLEDVGVPAELPATMNALKSQQFRWTKGAAENAIKNLRRVFKTKLPFSTKLHATFHLLNSAVFLSVFFSALLSIPVLLTKNTIPELNWMFRIVSLFIMSIGTLVLFYFSSYFRFRKLNIANLLSFIWSFPMFLSLTMGLSLHNAIAVIEGYIGKKSPFIRTPKFAITGKKDSWKENMYSIKKINPLTLVEGLLAIYYGFGVFLGFYYHDFGLIAFHIMLTCGFASIFTFSILHVKSA